MRFNTGINCSEAINYAGPCLDTFRKEGGGLYVRSTSRYGAVSLVLHPQQA